MATIIFDFDGTSANSFDYFIDFITKEAGRVPLNEDQKAALHGLSMARIARHVGISWWRMPGLFFKGRHQMSPAMQHIAPFEGMPEVIRKLHAEGHELFILSTNTVSNMRGFLHRHDLHTCFLEIYGGVGMFGKAPALRRLLREQNIDINKAVYVGDELRDVQAAQSISLRVIAVTWGFARAADLKAEGVTGLAESTQDILRIVENL
jgi:phosphoglycolate phosphatase